MTTQTLVLFIKGNSWMMTDSDPKVCNLFGTDTIETAFPSSVPAEVVLSTLTALNPNHFVTLG